MKRDIKQDQTGTKTTHTAATCSTDPAQLFKTSLITCFTFSQRNYKTLVGIFFIEINYFSIIITTTS